MHLPIQRRHGASSAPLTSKRCSALPLRLVGVVDTGLTILSGCVRHGGLCSRRDPPLPLVGLRWLDCSPGLLCVLQCSQPHDRAGRTYVSTVVVSTGQIALARDDADETALRRPDHGRRDRRRDSHLRGLPSLPVRHN